MSAIPYMPLYVADYLADTAHLTTEESGAYLLLIMNYWQRGKALPGASERLASIARMSNERWTDVERTLNEFFTVENGMWVHKRIESELARFRDKSQKAKLAGKASASGKKSQKPNVSPTDVKRPLNGRSTDVERTLNHTDTDTDKKEPPNPLVGGTRLLPMPGPDTGSPDIHWRDGRVVLTGKELELWLPRFGGDQSLLDNALDGVAAKHNPKSRYPLAKTVGELLSFKAQSAMVMTRNYEKSKAKPAVDQAPHRISVETRMNVKPAGYGLEDVANG